MDRLSQGEIRVRIRVILDDRTERVYDVLEMKVIASGEKPKSDHVATGDGIGKLRSTNVVSITCMGRLPLVSWDPTGDVPFGTEITDITIEPNQGDTP